MIKDLNQALNEAKKRRGVFSKEIIWESGVSKSQFYRIIKGQEAPSAETKARIIKSLGLTSEQFDDLFQRSKSEQQTVSEDEGMHEMVTPSDAKSLDKNSPDLNSNANNRIKLLAGIAFVLSFVFLVTGFMQRQSPEASQAHIAIEGDETLFIQDVSIPDGTPVPINTSFVKTWRIQNTGHIHWEGRYLKRMTPHSDLLCSSPALVPIPETPPGETVDISVTFRTPHLKGSCRTDWKMSDSQGNLFFPKNHGLYSIVAVIDE